MRQNFIFTLARTSRVRRAPTKCELLGVLLLLLVSDVAPSPSLAQEFVPLRIEDVLSVHEFAQLSSAEFSYDGKWLVYGDHDNHKNETSSPNKFEKSEVPEIAMGTDIVIVDTATGLTRNLTGGKGANWGATWSPRSLDLAFLSDRELSGTAKLWIWHGGSGTLEPLSNVATRGSEICWSPDATKILVKGFPISLPRTGEESVKPSADRTQSSSDSTLGSTVALYYSTPSSEATGSNKQSDPWSLEGFRSDLLVVDTQSGSTQRLATDERISKFSFSPDGLFAAFTTALRFEKPASQQLLWNLSVVSIGSGKTTVAASGIRLGFNGASYSWSPDSSRLAFQEGGPLASGDAYTVDLRTGILKNVTKFGRTLPWGSAASPLWDNSGQFIYLVHDDAIWRASINAGGASRVATIPEHRITEIAASTPDRLWSSDGGKTTVVLTYDDHGKQSGLYRLNLADGRIEGVLERGQFYLSTILERHLFPSENNRMLAFFSQDSQHDVDLWITDAQLDHARRLTHLNAQFDRYQLGGARLVDYRSLDGELLHGALLLPSDYQKGKQYPLIVWVYGGSHGSEYLNRFGLGFGGAANLQILATRGYAILFPDAPQHLGTPMLDLAKTVLPAVNTVIDMGIADADRVGVLGHSNGGYSVLSLIVQTKRFRAAVMEDGTGDLISAYGQMGKDGSAFLSSVTEEGQGLMGGTPWQYRDRYIENSPLFFLDRVETPLLIVHGGEDKTVAPFLGDEIFVGLRRLGKEAEYARYDGEGHSPVVWSHANQVDFCNRLISWFDRHLKTPLDKSGGF